MLTEKDMIAETYNGKPCAKSQMQVGNTFFTVISVQSEYAKETAYEKVKRLILANVKDEKLLSKSF